MNKAFIVKLKKNPEVSVLFRYFPGGFIKSYHFNVTDLPASSAASWQEMFPFHITDIDWFKKRPDIFIVQPVTADLSFEKFWNTYGNKVGNKKRSKRLWGQLNPTERARALAYIKVYDNYLWQNKGIAKAYPETYLNQKRWENE